MVETALVLPIVLLLLIGIVEFGRVCSAYLGVAHAARHGARHGAVGATNAEIVAMVQKAAPALNSSDITVAITPASGRQSGQDIQVTVTYPVRLISPLPGISNPLTVRSGVTMRIE